MALLNTKSFGNEATGQINIMETFQPLHRTVYTHTHWNACTDTCTYAENSFVSEITHVHCLCMQHRPPVATYSKTQILHFFSAAVFHSEYFLCSGWLQNYCLMIHSELEGIFRCSCWNDIEMVRKCCCCFEGQWQEFCCQGLVFMLLYNTTATDSNRINKFL